ncbi:hypothetical protein M758_11G132600 [Ceratodon purpureus]|uniref:Uncharacterized protein n=1 Tax=Ceratodon purpureus TaxID=3225 RepID=A0A8T0GIC1_CERPU|nr:hypothetical protein KC19_11G136200 [Ceratodon purpureus]KAG0601693.1 hypothetical protein M758_11G132600 [Ceratodon purpureus]
MAGSLSKPRVIVGLDFGTTFSGFAFAHISEPEKVYTHYDFPKSGGEKPYCKTLTASYYKKQSGPEGETWEFRSWGYPARAEYSQDLQAARHLKRPKVPSPPSDDVTPEQPSVGTYLTRFKLHLACKDMGASSAHALPKGLTVERLITDYLREMGNLIMRTLQSNYGAQLGTEVIQWCVTVPSIWDNAAKAVMKKAMTAAGLVSGADGSPHPLIMVLEPEAASFHCHKVMSEQTLEVGDRLLVADIGGGTSDIVVQEVVSTSVHGYQVKELTTSSGGLCGGTYVDARFMTFLHQKIGPCLHECVMKHPTVYAQLIKAWEHAKVSFGDRASIGESIDINLPNKLVAEWERYDERMGIAARESYDELEITYEEIQTHVFDPVVEQNMDLIARQLDQVSGRVRFLIVVGGFAGSPYLIDSIKRRFRNQVEQIISPPNPGSAVCQGAVALALKPASIASRISKKTYGFTSIEPFQKGVDPREFMEDCDGVLKCKNRFKVYVRKGEMVEVDECISGTFMPIYHGQKSMVLELLSCDDEIEPRYTVGEWVKKEGEIVIDVSKDMKLQKERRLSVSLYFGRSSLEIKAEALNFSAGGTTQLELPVEVGYL